MTSKEMITNVLLEHPCLTSSEIVGFVYRTYGEHITAQSVAGAMRPIIARGQAGKSYNDKGKAVYWLVTEKRW